MNAGSMAAVLVVAVGVLTSCISTTGDRPEAEITTAATLPPGTTDDPGPGFTIQPPPTADEPWSVDTAGCADPAAADATIASPLIVGTAAPQSGGLVSSIYAPVLVGYQAYIDQANANALLGDVQIELQVADDKGQPELTPVAVAGLLDAGASVISALPGSVNNIAVRAFLNTNCMPQLMSLASSSRLGDAKNFPWTMGGVVTDTVETTVYANAIRRSVGMDATVALLVSNDDAGLDYAASFGTAATDLGVDVVLQQTVEPGVIDAPTAQVVTMAAAAPQVIVASLSGAVCATFLTELGKARTALPDWKPDVYLGSDCADSSVLRLAGPAGNGVLSSTALVSDDPAFVARMRAAGLTDGFTRAEQGWTAAEATVAILIHAQASSRGLTRASIIDAARNLSFTPSLARPGVTYTTNGLSDAYPVESVQVVRYDAANQAFFDVGRLVAQFES
ncbi:MAG: ABC transporter substrate-binding protein [Ilumatobacteraceae bacterium]